MGYKTNQFFGIERAGEDPYYDSSVGPSGYETSADNPSFLYPSREVRTNDHSGYKTTQLRRGYMRSLRTQADGIEVAVKKCQFQFNPSVLEQSVTQAEGLLNVFQSDPAQYAQPMPGNVAFGFTLMFDRTMEVNNRNRQANYLNSTNPWELSDPGEVGVLRDLASLYSVIGQGITSYQKEYLEALLVKQAGREQATRVNDGETAEETGYQEVVDKGIPAFLDMNVGNTAFLLPVPVRIIFSSLYIVEGYVASTSVVFTKFSTQMVPIQCAVTVSVDAKYIGFAQKDTFLTLSLAREVEEAEAAQKQTLDTARQLSQAGSLAAGAVTMDISTAKVVGDPITLYDFLFSTSITKRTSLQRSSLKGGVDQSPILSGFNDGSINSGKINTGIRVFGPYTSEVLNYRTQTDLHNFVSILKILDSRGINPGDSQGDGASENSVASNKEEWTKLATGAYGPAESSSVSGTLPAGEDSFYIVRYNAEVTLKGNGDSALGQGRYYDVVAPNSPGYVLSRTISVEWPTYVLASDGEVVVTNPDRRTPGSSSSVGSGTSSSTVRPI